MFILKKGHQPGVYVPLRALFLVLYNTDINRYYFGFVIDVILTCSAYIHPTLS